MVRVRDASLRSADRASGEALDDILIAEWPQLRLVAWQLDPRTRLTPSEALNLYERNWRHLDLAAFELPERTLLQRLIDTVGGGRALV